MISIIENYSDISESLKRLENEKWPVPEAVEIPMRVLTNINDLYVDHDEYSQMIKPT